MNPERSMESYNNEDDNGRNVVALGASNDGKTRICPQSNICKKVVKTVSLDHVSVQQYAQREAHHMQPVFGSKDCGTNLESGVAKEPITTTMERHSKVGPSQFGKRRRLQFETTQEKSVENHPGSQNPSEFLDSSCADIPSSNDIQLTGRTQSACPSSLSQNANNNPLTVSKPSGIGLHLNSIVNARPLANISIKSIEGSRKKTISINSHMQDNMQYSLISSNSNIVENVSARNEEYTHETSYSNATSMETTEHQEKFDQGSLNSERAKKVDELDRSNPKKKRRKTERTGDGCKYCNCKKSKCLKLYCDCFAAGIYCADPCSCQGCLNRPEHESTVLETRQQIESRNPLAFAPKIVHQLTQPPKTQKTEDGDQLTPLAVRHKKGCNCKKSMCLKKYCECYQENVGCSNGCRCEGCQNIYGMKGVSGEASKEKLNDSYDDKLKVGSIRSRSSLPEFHKPDNLTPQTPSFQCSNHGKDASKALVFPQRYIPSPESECTFYPPYVTTPQSPITEASNKNQEVVPYDQESHPSIEFMDEFSPGCTTTPMNDWSHNSRAQLLPPSGVSFSSLRFGGSSITPVTLFGGAKLSDTQQKSVDIIDDDTPEILRDSFIEPGKVKVTSPNKKRISPPRIRLHELGSSTLKSGRKFILKAVSSFPPRTPCIDSKDHTGQNSNDPPHDSTL